MNRPCQFSNVTNDYLETFQCILDEMIQGMTGAELTDSISYNFIAQMIPHHQAAIEMSGTTLQYPICPELKPILDAIITSQKRGVAKMRRLLQCIRC